MTRVGGVFRTQMLKGHLPRLIYYQVYLYTTKATQQLYIVGAGLMQADGSGQQSAQISPPRGVISPAQAFFCPKVDGLVPHTQRVNLGTIVYPESFLQVFP